MAERTLLCEGCALRVAWQQMIITFSAEPHHVRRNMGRVKRNTCPVFYRKLVWKDGYNESKGLPSASQNTRVPRECGKAVLRRAWHAGYDAGEAEQHSLLSPEVAALSSTAVDVAAKLAREAGVDNAFASQLARLAKYGLSLL